jgi:LysM repeat protein
MKKLPLLLTFFLISSLLFGQSSEIVRNYIAAYKEVAIQEMQRTGVPASITLAQGIHETSAGQSDLVRKSNNHFGIKCKGDWAGASVSHDDDARGECFRKYDDPMESYKDHSDFLKNRPHYAFLFRLDPTDYEAWAHGLKKAGYATNPKYAQILIKLIKDYDLQDYTLIALDRIGSKSDVVFANNTAASDPQPTEPVATVTYPTGIFKINETRVMWITRGTSYLKVAEDNDVTLARLFEFNDMKGLDVAMTDHLLYLQRKRKKGANEFHIVAKGENLHAISQAEGIRLESLLGYNYLKENMQVRPGEKLYLQDAAPSMPALATDEPKILMTAEPVAKTIDTKIIFHTVQPKETLYAIARKYDVAVEDVQKWNEMQSVHLKTGQQLRINKKLMNVTN